MGRLMDADAEALQEDIPPQLAELAETIGKKANATAVFGSPSSMETGPSFRLRKPASLWGEATRSSLRAWAAA
jgi:hypothetical protein